VTTLEQIAQSHLDADSWADEEMMLAALREAAEQCARIAAAEWGRNGGAEHDLTAAVAAIRAWAEGRP